MIDTAFLKNKSWACAKCGTISRRRHRIVFAHSYVARLCPECLEELSARKTALKGAVEWLEKNAVFDARGGVSFPVTIEVMA